MKRIIVTPQWACATVLASICALSFIGAPTWAAPITVSGKIIYRAPTGNLNDDTNNALGNFPVRNARVELWDDNTVLLNLPPNIQLGTTYTDDNGMYSFSVDDTDSLGSILAGTIDPYLQIFPATQPALPAPGGVKSEVSMWQAGPLDVNGRDTLGSQWVAVTPSLVNVPPGQNVTINKDFGTGSNLDRSFASFDAMVEASRYYSTLPGVANNSVKALFPTNQSTSSFGNSQMHILQGDRYDWDVALHEYGHYVQSKTAGISNSPGGPHNPSFNLSYQRPTLARVDANRLAWGEGWATYFSISGQQVMNTAALGIQRVGDTIYNDNNDTNGTTIPDGLRLSIEDQSLGTSRGEDNENSVSRILYDLYDANNEAADRDRVTLGDKAIWNIVRNNQTDTLDKFWNALITQPGTSNSQRIDYGAIFQAQNVSPQPDITSVPDGHDFPEFDVSSPTFKWKIPTGGAADPFDKKLLNDFGLLFINTSDNIVWDTGLLGNVTSFTPNPFDWFNLTSVSDLYRWVVYGSLTTGAGASAYTTGHYWSDALYFTVGFAVPEPSTLTLAMFAGLFALRCRRWR